MRRRRWPARGGTLSRRCPRRRRAGLGGVLRAARAHDADRLLLGDRALVVAPGLRARQARRSAAARRGATGVAASGSGSGACSRRGPDRGRGLGPPARSATGRGATSGSGTGSTAAPAPARAPGRRGAGGGSGGSAPAAPRARVGRGAAGGSGTGSGGVACGSSGTPRARRLLVGDRRHLPSALRAAARALLARGLALGGRPLAVVVPAPEQRHGQASRARRVAGRASPRAAPRPRASPRRPGRRRSAARCAVVKRSS